MERLLYSRAMLVQAIVTPAVLISAAGLLILGVGNRYGRILDRIRAVNREILEAADGSLREELREDRDLFALRARRILLALTLLHAAVLCFVFESLLLAIVSIASPSWLTAIANGVVLFGILLFGSASVTLVSEARIAFETVKRETTRVDRVPARVSAS